jgi:uncharacterized protein YtpQ (UPF0354 family)
MRTRIGRLEMGVKLTGVDLARRILRDDRRARRGLRAAPRPVSWDWARPRLVPLLAGPSVDPPDQPNVRAVSDLGPALVFGLDLGRVYPLIDVETAERWEASAAQIRAAAMDNLRARAARTPASCVRRGTTGGWITTYVRTPAGLASSLVLVPDELRRLIGDHDQLIATPTRDRLVAMPADAPTRIIAGLVVEQEAADPSPLLLDPFLLEDGELGWLGLLDDDDDPDAGERAWRR